ncbi:MAG: S8 family serine peptidase [Rhizobium sp.]|nr:S8 family serine peptidase [Rhizobium sp.]
MLVGVLDTGIDADHAEFKSRQVEFRYFSPSALDGATPRNVRGFDTDGHGTHVCGIIAGKRLGLASGVNLHVAAVIESETMRASLWRTVYGLDWMFRLFTREQFFNVPCVVNLSLCFFEDRMTAEEVEDWSLVLGRAIDDLNRKDALVVAAAGNRGKGLIGLPAKFHNVLAIGAVDSSGKVADFSGLPTAGARRDLYGYGVDIHSAFERSKDGLSHYMSLNGTSMAAPYVAGIASMLRQTNPGASARDVRDHLLASAIDVGNGVRIARFQHWPGGLKTGT